MACELPTDDDSYEITLEMDEKPLAVYKRGAEPDTYAQSFIFMVYDSACYQCDLSNEECTEKPKVDGVSKSYRVDILLLQRKRCITVKET